MPRRSAAVLGVLLLLGGPLGLQAVGADEPVAPITTPEGFDSTEFNIRVFEDGSAEWTIRHFRPLENESQVETFRRFASRFNTQPSALARNFRNDTRLLVANVSRTVGRDMTATGFNHRASISELGGTRGVVELSYTWTNFSEVGDRTVVVADVFEGGLYIMDDQRLVFEHGPNLRFVQALPEPTTISVPDNLTQSESITWQGERQFSDRRPLVRLADPSTAIELAGRDLGTGGSDGIGADPEDTGDGGLGVGVVALLIVLILGLGLGAAWYVDALPADWSEAGETAADEPATAATPDPSPAAEPAVPEEEALSDEDRVLDLLERNGGRMKQVNIVDETDWSKSKVSMLLSEMEEDGAVSKLRVGRENIVSLAGHEPDAARSPFEEQ